ncbi:MAG: DHH family phosphoesterase [Negativicutes bacterium]
MWEWKVYNNSHIIIALGMLFLGFVWAYDWLSGLILTITSILVYYYFRRYFTERERQFFWYRHHVTKSIETGTDVVLNTLGAAIVILDEIGRIDWANAKFVEQVGAQPKAGDLVLDFWPNLPFDTLWNEHVQIVEYSGKTYRVTAQPYMAAADAHPQLIVFVEDVSEITMLTKAYENIMPLIMSIQIDNFADVMQGLAENQSAQLISEVTSKLNHWVQGLGGYIKKSSADSYIAFFNRVSLSAIVGDKFVILDEIREIKSGNRIPVTISIGSVVSEKKIADLAQGAIANLDLALGRGGDQVVITVDGETSFFGGKSNPTEKNTKVRVRVTAAALKKVMSEAKKIYVMGHKNEDFDCIGAAFGVRRMAKHIGMNACLVVGSITQELTDSRKLLSEYEGYEGFIVDDTINETVTPEDLLIIVDTHRSVLLSDQDFAARFSKCVVIDHHRRAEDFIDGPLLSYYEPSSSSASEMVVELIHYFGENAENDLTHIEASMLLAGIMLDTKNFTVQAGARTFEAAADLRRAGADISLVRRLFITNFDHFKLRAQIAGAVELMGDGSAIAVCPPGIPEGKIIAAQIADWLLTVEEVKSTFVLYPEEGHVNVSARSNGGVNVQIIMEKLGGGGHHTVAGAQVSGMTIDELKLRIGQLMAEVSGKDSENESDTIARS